MNKQDLAAIQGDDIVEYSKKKLEVDKSRIDIQHAQMQEARRELELLEAFDLSLDNTEYFNGLANESTEYLYKARKSKVFLNASFRGKVPFFPRNIILLAAETGSGKSTITANLAYNAIVQGQKVLVLTNEEHPSDVYNRITCLLKGWGYGDHERFTDEQIETFKQNIPALSKRLMVVGDDFQGLSGCTTTIEGVENVLNSVLKKNIEYNTIIIDYYQNVDRSVKVPNMVDIQVQYRLCKFLDQYKNKSNASIVVLAQKKTSQKDKEMSFKDAIEGRRTILNVATCAMNVIKDSEHYRTIFEIKKSRFNDCVGDRIYTGFDKGRYVPWTAEFDLHAQQMRHNKGVRQAQQDLMATVQPTGLNGEST